MKNILLYYCMDLMSNVIDLRALPRCNYGNGDTISYDCQTQILFGVGQNDQKPATDLFYIKTNTSPMVFCSIFVL